MEEAGKLGEQGRRISWLTRWQGSVAVSGAATAAGKPPAQQAARDPKKSRGHPLRTAAKRYARIQAMRGEYPIKVEYATLNGLAQWLRRVGTLRRAHARAPGSGTTR